MIALSQLAQAPYKALERYARWQQVELPRRHVADSDERYRLRVAHCIHFAIVTRECGEDALP